MSEINSQLRLIENKELQQADPLSECDDGSFGEKIREFGANLAHQTYDEVTELARAIPEFCEEVKDIGSKILPKGLLPSNSESIGNPLENYENLVAKGHKTIDTAFSTDQSELFTAEARANNSMNDFAIGILPLPGQLSKVFSNTTKLIT